MKRKDLNKVSPHGEVNRAPIRSVKERPYKDFIKQWVVISGPGAKTLGYNPEKSTIIEAHLSKWDSQLHFRCRDGKWFKISNTEHRNYLTQNEITPAIKCRELTKAERFIANMQGVPCELEEE